MRKFALGALVCALAASLPACSCSQNPAIADPATTNDDLASVGNPDAWPSGLDGGYPDGYVTASDIGIPIPLDGGGVFICHITPCQGKVYQCGDCVDNDGDGKFDSQDPDCLGACQNNEAGFFGAIPGQNNAPCKSDCYWDQDTGAGNDNCYWSHDCDPYEQGPTPCAAATCPELSCNYDPNAKVPGASVPNGQKDCAYLLTTQSTLCTNFCQPLTPNGCDCFGCCENPNAPGTYVYAGSVSAGGQPTCNSNPATLSDPALCKPCTPVPGCQNTCQHCELCFGKDQLPPDCYSATDMSVPPQQCPAGEQACGLPGQPECPIGYYCITGCCVALIP
jgi:hypothetical protein